MEDIILDDSILNEQSKPNFNPDIDQQRLISPTKFILLGVLSLGLYEIYWMYKVWKLYKQREEEDIWPVARALFVIFFVVGLFNYIQSFAKQYGYEKNNNTTALGIGVIIFNLLAKLPEPYWMISFLNLFFFIEPIKAYNYAIRNSGEVDYIEQESFNGKQIAVLVIGSIVWVLIVATLFLMPNEG